MTKRLLIVCMGIIVALTAFGKTTLRWPGTTNLTFKLVSCEADNQRCTIIFTVTNTSRKTIDVRVGSGGKVYDNQGEIYTENDQTFRGSAFGEAVNIGGYNEMRIDLPAHITVQLKWVINYFNESATALQLVEIPIWNSVDVARSILEVRDLSIPYPQQTVEDAPVPMDRPIIQVVHDTVYVEATPIVEESAPLNKPRLRRDLTPEQRKLWAEVSLLPATVEQHYARWRYQDSIFVQCNHCVYKDNHWVCAFSFTNQSVDTVYMRLDAKRPIAIESVHGYMYADKKACLVYVGEDWGIEPDSTIIIPLALEVPNEYKDDAQLLTQKLLINVPSYEEKTYVSFIEQIPITQLP